MLELKNISWEIPDGDKILKGIDLEIPDGKMTVITGPNGGGKTSLAKIIAGLEVPNSGEILLDGENITDWDITKRAKNGIAYAFQQPVRFKGVTVRDLLNLAAERTLSEREICSVLGEVGLCARDYIERDVDASLSGGESKRLLPFYRVKMRRYLYLTSLRQVLTFGALQVLLTRSKNLKTKAENPCL